MILTWNEDKTVMAIYRLKAVLALVVQLFLPSSLMRTAARNGCISNSVKRNMYKITNDYK